MEKTYYLAVDIGASSGRHILCSMEDGKLELQEIHRFENGITDQDGTYVWNAERLFSEIVAGMKKCSEIGKIPKSVGIDTWGVDFVLLDENDCMLGPAVSYRDGRTAGMDGAFYELMPEEELYARTGIQKQIFNTVYQLMAVKKQHPEYLEKAKTFLFIPDYFNFLLTGKKAVEYTIASTSQLLLADTKDWDEEILKRMDLPREIFPKIEKPGTVLGSLKPEIVREIGFDCRVILPCEHDTGSAVLAVPTNGDTVYISSGTWSLMGIERMEADCSPRSRMMNFTNEGGYDYRFRYLKNIMGLWMIQSVRKELRERGEDYSYDELCKKAALETIPSIVPCQDDRFLAPKSMILEIQESCRESGQPVPETAFELASVVYNSLAVCYQETIADIENITGKHYDHINVVGGGSNAAYLNEVTAKRCRRTVYAGPGEATAIGNMLVQMLADGVFGNLQEARSCVFESFGIAAFPAE